MSAIGELPQQAQFENSFYHWNRNEVNKPQLLNCQIFLPYRDYPSAPPSGLDTRPLDRRREIRPGPQPRR